MASTLPVTERPVPSLVEHRVLRFALRFPLYPARGLPVGPFMFAFPAGRRRPRHSRRSGWLKAMYVEAALTALMAIIIVKTYPRPAREE